MLKLVDIYPTTDKYKSSFDDKNIHKNMQIFINEARQQAKRAQKYYISDSIQDFNEKFQLQTQLLSKFTKYIFFTYIIFLQKLEIKQGYNLRSKMEINQKI